MTQPLCPQNGPVVVHVDLHASDDDIREAMTAAVIAIEGLMEERADANSEVARATLENDQQHLRATYPPVDAAAPGV